MKNAKVRAAIADGQKRRSERTNIDQDRVIFWIEDTAERCRKKEEYQPFAVLKAAELAGRHLGMFTDKLEVDGGLEGLGERMAKALQRVQDAESGHAEDDRPAAEGTIQ